MFLVYTFDKVRFGNITVFTDNLVIFDPEICVLHYPLASGSLMAQFETQLLDVFFDDLDKL